MHWVSKENHKWFGRTSAQKQRDLTAVRAASANLLDAKIDARLQPTRALMDTAYGADVLDALITAVADEPISIPGVGTSTLRAIHEAFGPDFLLVLLTPIAARHLNAAEGVNPSKARPSPALRDEARASLAAPMVRELFDLLCLRNEPLNVIRRTRKHPAKRGLSAAFKG